VLEAHDHVRRDTSCCLEAADMNVRTLGAARCGAPYPWRGVSLIEEVFWSCAVLWLFLGRVLKLVAHWRGSCHGDII
jgi:hypothetical protein